MAAELTPIDIRHAPPLAELVEEVRATRKPRRLVRDDEDVAVLMPAPPPTRRHLKDWRPRPEDLDAAVALAGAWRGQLDPEEFKRQRRELQMDDKPPRSL
ncbi:MAG: hypothetical protein M3336_00850 [Chloroflexota bacterium]|nr:hypothetical protein [Chloroflexota bacterium]